MATPLSDLPMPPNSQMNMNMNNQDLAGQQQFDLNSMIDQATRQPPQYQNDSNISAGSLQYQLDSSQIPQQGPNPNIQIQEDYMSSEGNPSYEYEMMEQEPELQLTLTEKITNEAKLPLVLVVLYVILSLPQFNRILTRYVPRFLAETGEINMIGLLSKGVLLALLYWIVKYFFA